MNNLNYNRLFIDMDSFYASIEQQDNPNFANKPLIVVPCLTDYTCAISASLEAKKIGIKTGTSVLKAKGKCYDIIIVEARPMRYVEIHNKLVKLLHNHFDNIKVLSIDEMAAELNPDMDDLCCDVVVDFLKNDIRKTLGEKMTCGIGIAPNIFLAKVAAELEKPNGYKLLPQHQIKNTLSMLNLIEFPGIKEKMASRLKKVGITTVKQLLDADMYTMKKGWQSINGIKWYYMLRGDLNYDYGKNFSDIPKTIGHSHVLPPEKKTKRGAEIVFHALLVKSLDRLNRYMLVAGGFYLYVNIKNKISKTSRFVVKNSGTVTSSNSTPYWMNLAYALWNEIEFYDDEIPTFIECRFIKTQHVNDVTLTLLDLQFESMEHDILYKIPDRIPFGDPAKLYFKEL
jgi:DNA polymerase-4